LFFDKHCDIFGILFWQFGQFVTFMMDFTNPWQLLFEKNMGDMFFG